MSGKNINFDDKNIKRSSFYKNKKINNIEDIDVNNILVSKKEPYGTTMSFIVKNKQLLKKYTKIWEKNEGLMRINLESKPVSGDHDKYIKTKIKYMQGV